VDRRVRFDSIRSGAPGNRNGKLSEGYLIVVNPTSVSIVMMVMMAKRLAVECIDGRRGRGEEERDRV